ncbi:MAG: hypothetical protein HYX36_01600 [Rhizobiales bacterium]|nr:hypothetical protein [Hyphomicrobiales bacterium]
MVFFVTFRFGEIVRTVEGWGQGIAGTTPEKLPCFDFNRGTFLSVQRTSVKGSAKSDRQYVSDTADEIVKEMEKCPYGKCTGTDYGRFFNSLDRYLNIRREFTYLYNRDLGSSGVEFVNSLYNSEAAWQIYRYLKKGYETDELSWLNLNRMAAASLEPWLTAKGSKVGVCKVEK